MVIVGIDPGITGALAVLWPDRVDVLDTPTGTRLVGGKTRTVLDPRTMADHLRLLLGVTAGTGTVHVVLEQAQPMRKEGRTQGVASTFATGYGFGVWEGILGALGLPWQRVLPVVWKRAFGLLGQPKGASLLEARRRFPAVDLKLAKHHGRAEALLIALWGAQQQRAVG